MVAMLNTEKAAEKAGSCTCIFMCTSNGTENAAYLIRDKYSCHIPSAGWCQVFDCYPLLNVRIPGSRHPKSSAISLYSLVYLCVGVSLSKNFKIIYRINFMPCEFRDIELDFELHTERFLLYFIFSFLIL